MENSYGLVSDSLDGLVYLPLSSVFARINIIDVSARVELIQVYRNTTSSSNAEARYIFPIPANAAVCAFKMTSEDGREIKGVVKKLETAKREYDAAVENNIWAGLLERLSGDVFVLSLGSLPPRQNVAVTVTYVQELAQDELINQVRFSLPTYVGKRYDPTPKAYDLPSTSDEFASFDVEAKVQMPSCIESITSPSHRHDIVCTDIARVAKRGSWVYTSTITFKRSSVRRHLGKDFVLSVQAADLDKPRCVAEVDMERKTVALSLTLVPKFGEREIASQEYVFLLDRSGSMNSDDRIEHAKTALQILLKSLPRENTFFNIVSFGSRFKAEEEHSIPYNAESVRRAEERVECMTANFGGTEIIDPLKYIFQHRNSSLPTSVFVITDGMVANVEQVIATVRKAVSDAGPVSDGRYLRVFTIGVGNGASTPLCEGIANAGRGICTMTVQSEDIAGRCVDLLLAAMHSPTANLLDIAFDWDYKPPPPPKYEKRMSHRISMYRPFRLFPNVDEKDLANEEARSNFALLDSRLVLQAPSKTPEVFFQQRFIISALLLGTTVVPKNVSIKGKMQDDGSFVIPVPVHVINTTPLLHTLAARRLIAELQEEYVGDRHGRDPMIKKAVESLSEAFQIASEYASFVAIDDGVNVSPDEFIAQAFHEEDDGFVQHVEAKDSPIVNGSVSSELEVHDNADGSQASEDLNDYEDGIGDEIAIASRKEAATSLPRGEPSWDTECEPHEQRHDGCKVKVHSFQETGRHSVESESKTPSTIAHTEVETGSLPHTRSDRPPVKSPQDITRSYLYRGIVSAYGLIAQSLGYDTQLKQDSRRMPSERSGTSLHRLWSFFHLDAISYFFSHVMMSGVGPIVLPTANLSSMAPTFPPPRERMPNWYSDFDEHIPPDVNKDLPPKPLQVPIRPPVLRSPRDPIPQPTIRPTTKPSNRNIGPIVRLQFHDGSFAMNDSLIKLLGESKPSLVETPTTEALKSKVPNSIRSNPLAETVWATVLAVALLRKTMLDNVEEWRGMWKKAKQFVLEAIGGNETMFVLLLEDAEALL